MWWSCLREAAAGPPCHFSPTASCCRTPQKVPWAGGNSSCLPLASCFLVISSADKHIRTRTVSLRWQARHYIASWGRKGGLCGEVEGGFGKGEELSGWIANRGGGRTVWMAAWMDGRSSSWMDQTEDTTAAGPTERLPAGWAACLDKVTQTPSFLLWDGDKVELYRAFNRLTLNLFYLTFCFLLPLNVSDWQLDPTQQELLLGCFHSKSDAVLKMQRFSSIFSEIPCGSAVMQLVTTFPADLSASSSWGRLNFLVLLSDLQDWSLILMSWYVNYVRPTRLLTFTAMLALEWMQPKSCIRPLSGRIRVGQAQTSFY